MQSAQTPILDGFVAAQTAFLRNSADRHRSVAGGAPDPRNENTFVGPMATWLGMALAAALFFALLQI